MNEARNTWRPHVTVATVVPDGEGRFLMVEEEIRGELRYNQPGGHLEPDETLLDAAARETLEETGWEVELQHFLGVQQWWSSVHHDHVVRVAFSGRALTRHGERELDTGVCRALWLQRDEVAGLGGQLRCPLVLTTIDDWLAGLRLPLSAIRSLPTPVARSP